MAHPNRPLTKSRFKIASECPTKLYFTGKPEYGNNNLDNAFLKALAEGGFQVGELAKQYCDDGIEVTTLDTEQAVAKTNELLNQNSVVIYEAAIKHENLLIRVDILRKIADTVELIEVKAKSFDPTEQDTFYNKRELKKGIKKLNSSWEPYLLDIAYQTHVVRNAFPHWKITSALMLADKSTRATVDGLNQLFLLETDPNGRTRAVTKAGTKKESLGNPVLVKVSVDDEVQLILDQEVDGRSFSEHVTYLAAAYAQDTMIAPPIGKQCKSCEFRIDDGKKNEGLMSGFEVCWSHATKLKPQDFSKADDL